MASNRPERPQKNRSRLLYTPAMRRLLLFAFVLACGGEAPSERTPDRPPREEAATNQLDPRNEDTAPPRPGEDPAGSPQIQEDIGWSALPSPPPLAAREALLTASRTRAAGDLEAAKELLGHALHLAPDFLEARFELARAASLTGDLTEAASAIETLWLRDLPTYGPRYDDEDDLATLRQAPEGRALGERRRAIATSYEAAMRGHSVVWRQFLPTRDRQPLRAQAGAWTNGRFVPMAPPVFGAVTGPDATSFATAYFDPQRHLSAAITGARTNTTGALTQVELHAFESPSGQLVGHHALPPLDDHPTLQVRARFTPHGLRWESEGRRGRLGPSGPLEGPTLHADEVIVPRSQPASAVVKDDAEVWLGNTEEPTIVALPDAHRRGQTDERTTDVLDLGGERLLVVTSVEAADGTERGSVAYAVTRVGRDGGAAELLFAGQSEHLHWRQGPGEALVEIGTRLYRIEGEGDPHPLPTGLGL